LPLVLAVIRQESAFHPEAKSRAGARGLMQLMPGTARKVAKGLRMRYSRRRLTAEPEFNVKLGQAYLGDLIKEFDGSYVLALAAYNAGPGRARTWLRANGDPRESVSDAIDWVEMVPIGETRNYIQRVLEGLQVYRGRLLGAPVDMTLERDLRR
jgi:soluble lytic murein transglycosylase